MDKKRIAQVYAESIRLQHTKTYAVHVALCSLSPDNYILGLSLDIENSYSNLVKSIIGDYNYDWLSWWMWECDFGEKPTLFFINEKQYDPSGMTFSEFWDLVYVEA